MIVVFGIVEELPSKFPRISRAYGSSQSSSGNPVDANIFVNLSKRIVPSVVNISTLTTVKGPLMQGNPEELFKKFFGGGDLFHEFSPRGRGGEESDDEEEIPQSRIPRNKQSRLPKAMSLGTGFIIDNEGLILTNNHVVADADEIKISFTESVDEKPSDAVVVGRDPDLDVALIKVKSPSKREMIPVVLGDSDALEVGEYVIAVGNPFGQGHSVTHGIISAKGRLAPDFPLAKYIQTDAPINPGNSGGPLVNLKGEVIGINNAIDQRAQGIGFAIPINVVKSVLPQLRTKGTVARGYIGVGVNNLTPEVAEEMGLRKDLQGPVVTHVYPGEPADKAGVKPYDVILSFNGKDIKSDNDLIVGVTAVSVGESVPIIVSRSGKKVSLNVKVGQRPGADQFSLKLGQNKKKRTPSKIEMGMSLDEITPEISKELGLSPKTHGIVVTNIDYGGPADKAGLLRGDVILEVDRKPVESIDSFYSKVREKKSYLLRVRRADAQGHELFSIIRLNLKDA